MYIHEQMASPAFNSVCCAVSKEWTKFSLAPTAGSLLLHLLNVGFAVIIDKTIAMGKKNTHKMCPESLPTCSRYWIVEPNINGRFYMAANLFFRKSILHSSLV